MEDVEGSVGLRSTKKPRSDSNDAPPPEFVGAGDRQVDRSRSEETADGGIESLSDKDLEEKISRLAGNVARLSSKLPDKGAKLIACLKAHEAERERRKQLIDQKPAVECKETDHMKSSSPSGAFSESGVGDRSGSRLANPVRQKSETDKDSHTRIYDVFSNEPEADIRIYKRKRKQKALPSQKNALQDSNKPDVNESEGLLDKKEPIVVERTLDTEEEAMKREERTSNTEEEAMRDVSICYPSSEDPNFVEVRYKDLKDLDPGEYLTSSIMNFYIRFLQVTLSAADDAQNNYYFFNTYFFKKLQGGGGVLKLQKPEREASFEKLRRWWKGVNLFEKTYIFLPVHYNLHWSLAIICIPDKEDESGPIILHLDSLGYHCSEAVFLTIKRLLMQEWFIQKKNGSSDVPFSNAIWERLPKTIEMQTITVPRQNNDSDCGVFVLYFMERFIKDAPKRMKMSDLAMFGRSWFKPEEASSFRTEIKKTVLDEFAKSKTRPKMEEAGDQIEANVDCCGESCVLVGG